MSVSLIKPNPGRYMLTFSPGHIDRNGLPGLALDQFHHASDINNALV